MKPEEALQIIEETERDYKQKQHILRGLQILAKYDDDLRLSFEHDQMWVCDFNETVTLMTKEDVAELARYGWFESQDSWSHF